MESDKWYVDYVSKLAPDELRDRIDFTFTDGAPGRMSREEMLAHVLLHGDYHRGGISYILAQLQHATPKPFTSTPASARKPMSTTSSIGRRQGLSLFGR